MENTPRVTSGSASIVDVPLPRYQGRFTAYVANPDLSSTCITVTCGHAHTTIEGAEACVEKVRFRAEKHPEKIPTLAEELRRRQ